MSVIKIIMLVVFHHQLVWNGKLHYIAKSIGTPF